MTTVITAVPDGIDVFGKSRVTFRDFTLSGTYAALTINAQDVGMKYFKGVVVVGGDASLGTYFPVVTLATTPAGKLVTSVSLGFVTATGTAASGTLSPDINIRLLFIGG